MSSVSSYLRALFAAAILFSSTISVAQGIDVEPNDSCLTAQEIGNPDLPFTLSGNLEALASVPDIDFFRFSGAPGASTIATHQGASSGNGTLGDPLLGLFDSSCNLLTFNDDSGSLDSRLVFRVPADGTYVLAATAFPDFQFIGAGEGTYLLSVDALTTIDSIFGRFVNADDGSPVSGENPTFAVAILLRCQDGFCFEFVNSQNADSDGNFRFESDFNDTRLTPGTYQLQAFANGFEFFTSDTFDVAENEAFDLGDVALTPLRLIGSISGQVVDSFTGLPVPGNVPPFAVAQVDRCEPGGECFGIVGLLVDDQGRFHFDGLLYGLSPGIYRVSAFADDYESTVTEQFEVGESEDFDAGMIPITPFPIQFGEVHGCEIPPGGGLCEFGIEVRNRSQGRLAGSAWSTIDFFPNQSPFRGSRFQVGRLGARFPNPQRITLKAGQSTVLTFQLFVPGTLPNNSFLCATATVGTGPQPHFNNQGDRFIFCAVTQGNNVQMLSDREGRDRFLELKRQSVQTDGRSPRASRHHQPSGKIRPE